MAEGCDDARRCPVEEWLVTEAGMYETAESFFQAFAEQQVASGIPVFRQTAFLRTLHPQVVGRTLVWKRGRPSVDVVAIPHGMRETPQFASSPFAPLMEGAGAVRRRLDLPDPPRDFPILDEIRAEGATDYVALPLAFTNGFLNFLTWATDEKGGFRTEQLDRLYALLPLLSLRLELLVRRELTGGLMEIYLGHDAGRRVLDGAIRRGEGRSLEAVIWLSDLRDFTARSDRTAQDRMVELLNAHFERLAVPIRRHGGDVLKFMGDGILAIFPIGGHRDAAAAASAAMDAAEEAFDATAALNGDLVDRGEEPIAFGLALHVGEVTYGNIGAEDRLDFTVIGPAVNHAARIEMLTKTVGSPILASGPFADLAARPMESLGAYPLRGVAAPIPVFRPVWSTETGYAEAASRRSDAVA